METAMASVATTVICASTSILSLGGCHSFSSNVTQTALSLYSTRHPSRALCPALQLLSATCAGRTERGNENNEVWNSFRHAGACDLFHSTVRGRELRRCSVSNDSSSSASSPVASSESQDLEAGEQEEIRTEQNTSRNRRKADSSDWISSSLTRRFGLAGGLAWFGFLAFGVVSEQIKTRTEVFFQNEGTQDVQDANEVPLDNGVKYVDLRQGGGPSPLRGNLVVIDVTGRLRGTGQIFLDTTSGTKRPLAFVYGLKPYARGLCYGLESALQSMKAGGKRKVSVPASQCFGDAGADLGDGLILPGGADIEYEVQLQKVAIAPS